MLIKLKDFYYPDTAINCKANLSIFQSATNKEALYEFENGNLMLLLLLTRHRLFYFTLQVVKERLDIRRQWPFITAGLSDAIKGFVSTHAAVSIQTWVYCNQLHTFCLWVALLLLQFSRDLFKITCSVPF